MSKLESSRILPLMTEEQVKLVQGCTFEVEGVYGYDERQPQVANQVLFYATTKEGVKHTITLVNFKEVETHEGQPVTRRAYALYSDIEGWKTEQIALGGNYTILGTEMITYLSDLEIFQLAYNSKAFFGRVNNDYEFETEDGVHHKQSKVVIIALQGEVIYVVGEIIIDLLSGGEYDRTDGGITYAKRVRFFEDSMVLCKSCNSYIDAQYFTVRRSLDGVRENLPDFNIYSLICPICGVEDNYTTEEYPNLASIYAKSRLIPAGSRPVDTQNIIINGDKGFSLAEFDELDFPKDKRG